MRNVIICLHLAVLPAWSLRADIITPPVSTYQADPCGGAYPSCNFDGFQRTPTVADTVGLTNDLFEQFFAARGFLPGGVGVFDWTPVGSNDNGYVFGAVSGSNEIYTEFIYHQGQLLCCSTDEPFTIVAINDNDLVIGGTGVEFALLAPAILDTDRHNVPLKIFTDPPDQFIGALVYLALDNDNRILAEGEIQNRTQDYVLQPIPPFQATPEVSSMALLASGLAFIGGKWRLRTARAAGCSRCPRVQATRAGRW